MGSVLSIITIITILTYAGTRVETLLNKSNYKIQQRHLENYFNYTDTFSIDDDFMVGAAVTAYDGNKEDITDLTIG